MGAQLVLSRIAAWEQAGLIDHVTADHLREVEESAVTESTAAVAEASRVSRAVPVSIPELFAYLGAFFALLAWHATTMANVPYDQTDSRSLLTAAVPAAVLTALGYLLVPRSDERSRRAGGVAWLLASGYVAAMVYFAERTLGLPDTALVPLVAAVCGVLAAARVRRRFPALTTQLGLVLGVVYTAWFALLWLNEAIFGANDYLSATTASASTALLRVGLAALWWWLAAVVLEILARQAVSPNRPGAEARRVLTRLGAGLTAILGTTTAISFTAMRSDEVYASARVLGPAIGDVLLLAACGVLVLLAARLRTTAYLWPAALGVLMALSDLNTTYVVGATGTGPALFVEALILFGVALATHALRRALNAPPAASGLSTPVGEPGETRGR